VRLTARTITETFSSLATTSARLPEIRLPPVRHLQLELGRGKNIPFAQILANLESTEINGDHNFNWFQFLEGCPRLYKLIACLDYHHKGQRYWDLVNKGLAKADRLCYLVIKPDDDYYNSPSPPLSVLSLKHLTRLDVPC
jgi:hypothetical protein